VIYKGKQLDAPVCGASEWSIMQCIVNRILIEPNLKRGPLEKFGEKFVSKSLTY